ncbi:MAG: efflux RND transporter periplasmic adaptor subunit [Pseudomonadales bacterium]|nr:efflux RND transporter periplasmic adaptor subunit [Pseudomonadales bacterium]
MNKSVIFAFVLSLIAIAWLATGNITGPNSVHAQEQSAEQPVQNEHSRTGESQADENKRFTVRVTQSEAREIDDVVFLNGDIEAYRDVEIRAELDGRITQVFFEKGQRVRKGEAILTVDLGDLEARLARAKADLKARESDVKAAQSLKSKNLSSENQYQQDLANLAAAQAEVKAIQVQIANATVRAPFPGIINDLPAELGDYASKGSHVATLVDDSRIKIVVEVPQQHIAKLKIGMPMEAELLNGGHYRGEIVYLSSRANNTTRTFTVEALASRPQGAVYFGQSADIEIVLGQEWAHKLSPSTLDLDTEGNLQVKVLNNDQVEAHTVTIVRSERDGVWLKGLPRVAKVITTGQGFVISGQKVKGVPEQKFTPGETEKPGSDGVAMGESEDNPEQEPNS